MTALSGAALVGLVVLLALLRRCDCCGCWCCFVRRGEGEGVEDGAQDGVEDARWWRRGAIAAR